MLETTIRPTGCPDWSISRLDAGATGSSSEPASIGGVAPSVTWTRARAGAAREVAQPALHRQPLAGPDRRRQRRVRRDPRRRRARLVLLLGVQAGRGPLGLGEARVGLAALRPPHEAEQDDRDDDHRDDHDPDEEERQATPEAPEGLRAGSGGRHMMLRAKPAYPRTDDRPRWPRTATIGTTCRDHERGQPTCGAIAQLGERLDRTQEVGGSSPPSSTSRNPRHGADSVVGS